MRKKMFKQVRNKLPSRVVSVLLVTVMIAGLFSIVPFTATALGGWSTYDIDGKDYYVEWSEDVFGEGTAYMECEYCGHVAECDFSDGDHDGAASSIIDFLFPYDCEHCKECAEEWHCEGCGECFDTDAPSCSDCNTMLCENCHEPDMYCVVCGSCVLWEGADGRECFGLYSDAYLNGSVCQECWDESEYCAECGRVMNYGDCWLYEESGEDWCPNCMLCPGCVVDYDSAAAYGHCKSCGVCGDEVDVCGDCFLCTECSVGLTHCPECDECFGEDGKVEWCPSGGEHCVLCDDENEWICLQCGECMDVNGLQMCDFCWLCEECCLLNSEAEGCIHGYCVESPEYEDHVCPECGLCPEDMECEFCELCQDCQENYHCEHEICPENYDDWEEHTCDSCGQCFEIDDLCEFCHMCEDCWEHCDHGYCPEDSDFDDHICDQCGDCYDEDEFCDVCGLCVYCCLENTEAEGCDHDLCIESSEFQEHYCFEDNQCLEYCDHIVDCDHYNVDSKWLKNTTSHWRKCTDCGESVDAGAHEAGSPVIVTPPNAATKTNGTGKLSCKICGQSMGSVKIPYDTVINGGKPYILSEPQDYTGKVSDVTYGEKPRYATFSVTAGGEDLKYQWYMYRKGYTQPVIKLTDGSYDSSLFDISGKQDVSGANTYRLTVYVEALACYEDFSYYCVITNSKGSVTTRYAKLDAKHVFSGDYESYNAKYHYRKCVGDGCEEHGKLEEHRLGSWMVTKNATATSPGYRQRKCMDCGVYVGEYIPRVDPNHVHKFSNLRHDDTQHWYECDCGVKSSAAAQKHSFGSWAVTKAATEKSVGKRERSCTVCGYVQSERIDKLPHTHNFTTLKDKKQTRYNLPNGKITSDYHYRYCAGCSSYEFEPHAYGAWAVMNTPFTDKYGTYHMGTVSRRCYICGHEDQQQFTEQYPILTECWDGENAGTNEQYLGATISSPVAANPGEKVTITATLNTGYSNEFSEWSIREVTSTEGVELGRDKWVAYKNSEITDFTQTRRAKTVISCEFTMPNGPVAILLLPGKCDHKGKSVYKSLVGATCTGYGAIVNRCSGCNAIVEELERVDPAGHNWKTYEVVEAGDCDTRAVLKQYCTNCSAERQHNGDYNHSYKSRENAVEPSCTTPGHKSDYYCTECGKEVKGERLSAYGAHTWGAWETVREATTTVKGKQEHTCTRCGITQSEFTDFSGPDYRLKAENTKLSFSYIYGEEVKPQTVKIDSVGRNEITGPLFVFDSKISEYDIKSNDDMSVSVAPNLTKLILNEKINRPQTMDVNSYKTDENGDFISTPVTLTTNVQFPKGKFKINLDGAKFKVYNSALKDFEPKERSSAALSAGTIISISANDAKGFNNWVVENDKSGMVQAWIDESMQNDEQTIYIVMPPSDVDISAVDSTLKKLNFTLEVPQVGEDIDSDWMFISGDSYSDKVEYIAQWRVLEGGEYKEASGKFEDGKKYYLWGSVAKSDDLSWYTDKEGNLLTEFTVNGKPARELIAFDGQYAAVVFEVNAAKSYDLYLGGIQLNSDNLDDITRQLSLRSEEARNRYEAGTMSITFDPASNTLTLKNAIIDTADLTAQGATFGIKGLNVVVEGDCQIIGRAVNGIRLTQSATISGSGTLTVSGKLSGVSYEGDYTVLTLNEAALNAKGERFGFNGGVNPMGKEAMFRNSDVTVEGGESAFTGMGSVLFPKCTIMTPAEAKFRNYTYYDGDNPAKTVVFESQSRAKAGDVNRDGKITVDDATLVQMYVAKLIGDDGINTSVADVNRDGKITIDDATLIQMYVAKLITEF